MPSRRDFLKTSFRGASLIALSPTVPAFLAGAALAAGPSAMNNPGRGPARRRQ